MIFFMMMATAFLGYTLPWGQMSFWGATVITNLFSAVPFFGESIVTWLWGGYSVDDQTLNRFFVLHWVIAFGIVAVVLLHVTALHITGSNNPAGIEPKKESETLTFNPFMTIKDLYGALVFFGLFALLLFLAPNYLGHPDNYHRGRPAGDPGAYRARMVLPAVLRDFTRDPGQAVGRRRHGFVDCLAAALPWLDRSKIRSCVFRPVWKWLTLLFVVNFFVLMWVGAKPAEGIYVLIAQVGTFYWFAYLLILAPLVGKYEKPKRLPKDIHEFEEMKRNGDIRFLPFPIWPSGGRKSADGKPEAVPAE